MFKSLSLFTGNALVAAFSELFSVSISHSKNVVCLNSLICATVTWDWFAEFEALLLRFNAEEDFVSLFKRLTFVLPEIDSRRSIVVESGRICVEMLLVDNLVVFVVITSVEFPYGHWINWLLQIWSAFQIIKPGKRSYQFHLPSYRCLVCVKLRQ